MNYGFLFVLMFINLLNSGFVEGQTARSTRLNLSPTLSVIRRMCNNLPTSNQHVKMCQQGQHLSGGAFYKDMGLTMRCMCIQMGMAGAGRG
jgi:hypothetical protein